MSAKKPTTAINDGGSISRTIAAPVPIAPSATPARAGFSVEMSVHAFYTLDSYVYGFALQEHNLPSGTPEELAGVAETILAALPADEYPYLRETIVDYVVKTGFDPADEFEFGLNLVLDGLVRLRAST